MALDNMDNEYFGNNPEVVKLVRQMCLFDDDFMSVVFSKPACAEYLLRLILDKKDLSVISSVSQYEIKNVYGRSVRLDILAKDSNGKLYDIEVQRKPQGASAQRAFYNACLLKMSSLEKGEEPQNSPQTIVIFITETDVRHLGLPVYDYEFMLSNGGDVTDKLNDGTHIIYVNGAYRNDTELGRLMQDFSEKDPDKFNHKMLGDEVRRYKYSEEGVDNMCKIMEDYGDKRAMNERRQLALKMIADGKLSFEDIAKYSDLTLEEVKALAESESA